MAKWVMDESGDLINLDRMNAICADDQGSHEGSRFRVRCLGNEWESTLAQFSTAPDAIAFMDDLIKTLEK